MRDIVEQSRLASPRQIADYIHSDDVRQNEGFKNVSLGNVLSAKSPNEPTPFIRDEDQEVYDKYKDEAFEVQVGL